MATTTAPASVTTAPTEADSTRGYNLEILLISLAALLLEISYTRIISFKLFYYYTYLVIGLALLGIGTGGVLVALSDRLRRASTDAILMWGLLSGAASVGIGYFVVALLATDTLAIWDYGTWDSVASLVGLLVICLAMFSSFVAAGLMIATLFGRRSEQIGRLYFADLLGAGLACAVVVSLIGWIGPPATIFLAALILAVAGLRIAWRVRSRAFPAGAALAVLCGVAVVAPGLLPEVRTEASKAHPDESNTLFSSWSPIFRVDVVEVPDGRLLFHDGLVGSGIHPFNGDVSTLSHFDRDPRALPFAALGTSPDDVMIIGAAGGNEILASLYFDAGHIDAIELNPVTYDLVTDRFADYSGHLAENPKVNYVRGDGRSYLARSDNDYDIIWFPAPDSYAASNAATAGAFVLSESYLDTSDAIVESFDHLGPDGIVAVQYGEFNYAEKPNRTTRYVATARHALEERGIEDPDDHIVVTTVQTGVHSLSTILVKETPFTPTQVDRVLGELGTHAESQLRYAPGHPVEGESVTAVATLSDSALDDWYDSYPYEVGPITDDGPFFWHFTSFRDVIADFTDPIDPGDPEDSVGERVLLLLLAVATIFAAVFLLAPFFAIRGIWRALPHKPMSALYFSCLGLGFLFFEITLIQKLVLFLGYPTYSLTVTLASILIFTGVGALLSSRWRDNPGQILPALLAAIAALTVFYAFGLQPMTDALLGWPLAGRVLLAFAVLAPLGVCLGMFMPLGLGAVAGMTTYSREYVAWGWAVNGFASVVGAVLTTILAMQFGFRTVLFVALAVYGVAVLALRGLLRDTTDVTPVPAEVTVPVEPEASVAAPSPAPS